MDDSNAYIQKLNDEYTNPSGGTLCETFVDESLSEKTHQFESTKSDTDDLTTNRTAGAASDN